MRLPCAHIVNLEPCTFAPSLTHYLSLCFAPSPHQSDAKSKRLYCIFNCAIKCEVIKNSVLDLGKLVANLQAICDVIDTNQLEDLYVGVEGNCKVLVDAGGALVADCQMSPQHILCTIILSLFL